MNWKSVTGFERLYLVSDLGQVKSLLTKKILKGTVNKQGYIVVGMCRDGKWTTKLVHRLVAYEFHSLSFFIGAQVNHKDGNRQNNNISNLEWVTQADNVRHSFVVLGRKTNNPLNGSSSKAIKQIDLATDRILGVFPSAAEACRRQGFNAKSSITNCLKGLSKSAFGFKWEYV